MQQLFRGFPFYANRRGSIAAGLLIIMLGIASCVIAPIQSTREDAAGATEAPSMQTTPAARGGLLPPEEPPRSLTLSPWATDFSRRTVEWAEIRSGGPPKDGIPAIDHPEFEGVQAAAEWLSDRDPIILFSRNDDVRGYPLAILMWHEIVNDHVGGEHVTVTFCPLCNASIVFEREFDGLILDFGTTGLLRNSDLVMYDRQTETWWQQFTGQGLVGEYAGEQLGFLAAQVISFADFARQFPDAQVLARPAAARAYGVNPYTEYDTTSGRPFLFDGQVDTRLDTMERVAGVFGDATTRAYPFRRLAVARVVNDELEGAPIVLLYQRGTASALDTRVISEGRDIGSVGVFSRMLDGQTLTFEAADGRFRDTQTGTIWNHLGLAMDGELAGAQLERRVAFDHFWFAWAAFFPDTEIYE